MLPIVRGQQGKRALGIESAEKARELDKLYDFGMFGATFINFGDNRSGSFVDRGHDIVNNVENTITRLIIRGDDLAAISGDGLRGCINIESDCPLAQQRLGRQLVRYVRAFDLASPDVQINFVA